MWTRRGDACDGTDDDDDDDDDDGDGFVHVGLVARVDDDASSNHGDEK